MKPFLILQLRPETDASDDEFRAFLSKGGLDPDDVQRIRLDQEDIPADLSLDAYSGVIVGGGPGCVSDAPDKKSALEARIEAACLPDNLASQALLRRIGFGEEGYAREFLRINGRWQDHLLFGMLRDDWRQRRR